MTLYDPCTLEAITCSYITGIEKIIEGQKVPAQKMMLEQANVEKKLPICKKTRGLSMDEKPVGNMKTRSRQINICRYETEYQLLTKKN
jgi:hypothetical protein